MLTFIYGLLDRHPRIVRFAARVPFLRHFFSNLYINIQAYSAPARPFAYSLGQPYTTWRSLTDKTFTGRHLPEATQTTELPPINKVVELWRRKNDQEIPSYNTSMLFSFFAQWFTDSFLRTNLLDRRRNTSNHEIDLCQIYGLNEAATNCLRLKTDGKLKYQIIDGAVYPPYLFDVEKTTADNWVFASKEFETLHPRYALDFICRGVPEERLKYMFAVGLEHGNSAVGYTLLNTIMLREHNRVCDLLKTSHADWDDERLFQTARNIMIVQLIKIVIGDYIGQFSRMDFNLDPTPDMAEKQRWYRSNWISLEFNLLYRWHSMVPEHFVLGSETLPLSAIRSNTALVTKHGVGPLIDAASRQRTGQIGLHNTPGIFFEPMPMGTDNRSVMERTVAMGRDAKLRSFNDYREAFSYPRLKNFDELTDDVDLREELRELYGNRIDDLEWHVGIFAEQSDPGFILGRLLTRMVAYDAFTHALTNPLMATAVFNEDTFSKVGLELVSRPVSISAIIHRNISEGEAVAASFATPAESNGQQLPASVPSMQYMSIRLPQHERDARQAHQRKARLETMRAKYEYAYDYANTIAIVRKLPWREIPGLRYWWLGALNLARLLPSVPNLVATVWRYWRGKPLASYSDYVFYPMSPQPNPHLVDNFQDDLQFGLQRVIGCNPVVLRAVSQQQPLPVKISATAVEQIFADQISGIAYAEALAEKRLYVLDYAMLAVLRNNPGYIDGNKQHIATPIVVLFQQDNGTLRPLAIQLDQSETGSRTIYTPRDGNLWLAAKTQAQIADGNHHILYTHATRIHYVMEAVIMASRRQLDVSHPLYVLLEPHLKFTLNVNHQHTFLKNRRGQPGRFGQLFAGDYEATTQCMADGMTSYNFAEAAFPKDIAGRQVDNPALFYPYRDDGLLLWESIQYFASAYVNSCYKSDDEVKLDSEINAWAHDISAPDRGRIPGFPAGFECRKVLAETIGQIIFHCTAHHSCIHFNQYSFPGFVPNMPYASYVPPPAGHEKDIDASALMKIQPAFRAAYTQTWTYFLTNYRVNRIGEYELDRFDANARDVILRFRARLQEIESEIESRNRTRIVDYHRMQPSLIPNGVTV